MDTDNILLDDSPLSFGLDIDDELPKFPELIEEVPVKKVITLHEKPIVHVAQSLPTGQSVRLEQPTRATLHQNPQPSILKKTTEPGEKPAGFNSRRTEAKDTVASFTSELQKKPLPLPVHDGGRRNGNSENTFKLGSLNVPKETAYLGIGLAAVAGLLFYVSGKKPEKKTEAKS